MSRSPKICHLTYPKKGIGRDRKFFQNSYKRPTRRWKRSGILCEKLSTISKCESPWIEWRVFSFLDRGVGKIARSPGCSCGEQIKYVNNLVIKDSRCEMYFLYICEKKSISSFVFSVMQYRPYTVWVEIQLQNYSYNPHIRHLVILQHSCGHGVQ